jgi:hypothetical protein
VTTHARYRVNRPRVIAQEIDGEVVAIHLETGNYYSLLESGADVWAALEATASEDDLVTDLGLRYEGDEGEIRAAVSGFLAQLDAEGLITTDDGGPVATTPDQPDQVVSRPGPGDAPRIAFKAPSLEKFDDMQDLILLDPVHEVTEEQGWPHPK